MGCCVDGFLGLLVGCLGNCLMGCLFKCFLVEQLSVDVVCCLLGLFVVWLFS